MKEENITGMVEKLKVLSSILEKNSYIKDTSFKLDQLIEDAQSPYRILFIGSEIEGKNTLINALVERNLLPEKNEPHVNIFIRYGQKECIRAILVDGTAAYFGMEHLYLFTDKNTYIGQFLKTYIKYIEIYLRCDLLKNVILMNTISMEKGEINISDALLQRTDEVFWVLGNHCNVADREISVIKKIYRQGYRTYLIINTDQYNEQKMARFLHYLQKGCGHMIEEFVGVSAKQAMEAKKSHQIQLFIDSRIHRLVDKINHIANKKDKRERNIALRFKQWMVLLEREVHGIKEREPFMSMRDRLEKYLNGGHSIEQSIVEKNLKILSDYEKEYAHVSQVLQEVQTLYQLLKVIEYEKYLMNDSVELFVALALKYHEKVREYRSLHSEYMMEYQYYEKLEKKFVRNKMLKPLFQDQSNEAEMLLKKAEKLNRLQRKCKETYNAIKRIEFDLLNDLYTVQGMINELAEQQLEKIVNKARHLKDIHNKERMNIEKYINKLKEFECLKEMQEYLQQDLKAFIEREQLAFSKDEMVHILSAIDQISASDLFGDVDVFNHLTVDSMAQHFTLAVDFKEKYPFSPLVLTETDIISDIPPIPAPVEIQQILEEQKTQ